MLRLPNQCTRYKLPFLTSLCYYYSLTLYPGQPWTIFAPSSKSYPLSSSLISLPPWYHLLCQICDHLTHHHIIRNQAFSLLWTSWLQIAPYWWASCWYPVHIYPKSTGVALAGYLTLHRAWQRVPILHRYWGKRGCLQGHIQGCKPSHARGV